ncbi:MAG: metallophosphoesterase [Tannerella sp.]|jgi:predicted MPP superfamily phosphohydrolase|nr:metallophosphoesterase [Tannerella sp.]
MRVFLHAIWGQTLLNAYIAWQGYGISAYRPGVRKYFLTAVALEFTLYLTGFFFYRVLPEKISDAIVVLCNTWYIASIYIALGLLLLHALKWCGKRWKRFPKPPASRLPQYRFRAFASLFAVTLLLMIKGYHDANCPVVKHVHIHIPKAAGGRDSLTVALMCDLHFGERIGRTHARRFVSLCNAQNPDMVVIPGDVIDYESHLVVRDSLKEELRKLKAPLGVYITLGNHEYRANRHAKLNWLKETGAIVLVDSVAMPDSTFYLTGRDDATNRRRATLAALMRDVDLSKPVILLDHQPIRLNETVMNRADLSLHGHTHNGQVWPNVLALQLYFECSYGYYRKGNTQFYVTSGIGFAGPPFRIGTRAELVVLHITFGKPGEVS